MKKCNKKKKWLYMLPNLAVAGILLMAAFGKLSGSPESIELFKSLDLLGMGGDPSRIGLGIIQVIVALGLFSKEYYKLSAFVTILMMIGAFILVGVHGLAIVTLILALVILWMAKKCEKKCGSGTCDSDMKSEKSEM